jgi:hypothetical protein
MSFVIIALIIVLCIVAADRPDERLTLKERDKARRATLKDR